MLTKASATALHEGCQMCSILGTMPGGQRSLTVALKAVKLSRMHWTAAQVYALIDRQGTGAPEVVPILDALTQPNGVAWLDETLFVAQPDAILQYRGADDAVLAGKARVTSLPLHSQAIRTQHGIGAQHRGSPTRQGTDLGAARCHSAACSHLIEQYWPGWYAAPVT